MASRWGVHRHHLGELILSSVPIVNPSFYSSMAGNTKPRCCFNRRDKRPKASVSNTTRYGCSIDIHLQLNHNLRRFDHVYFLVLIDIPFVVWMGAWSKENNTKSKSSTSAQFYVVDFVVSGPDPPQAQLRQHNDFDNGQSVLISEDALSAHTHLHLRNGFDSPVASLRQMRNVLVTSRQSPSMLYNINNPGDDESTLFNTHVL